MNRFKIWHFYLQGARHSLHVQHKVANKELFVKCTDKTCKSINEIAGISNHSSIQCIHIKPVALHPPISTNFRLKETYVRLQKRNKYVSHDAETLLIHLFGSRVGGGR